MAWSRAGPSPPLVLYFKRPSSSVLERVCCDANSTRQLFKSPPVPVC